MLTPTIVAAATTYDRPRSTRKGYLVLRGDDLSFTRATVCCLLLSSACNADRAA
jgi:hypothetical protein